MQELIFLIIISCSPLKRQIFRKNKQFKFIDMAKQGMYTRFFKGSVFKTSLYFVLRPLLGVFWPHFCSRKARSGK